MVKDSALSEITLRKYEKPYHLDKRELVKKICLSLGLLQAGDSRDVIVDILLVLLESNKEKTAISSDEIKIRVEELRKKYSLEMKGIAESNIRRQLKRLRDLMLIEKKNNMYNISEFESLNKIFNDKIENFLIPQTIERIKEYLAELEKEELNQNS
ncbi:hypothetical protein A3K73_03450 [Candidatus Pacearchaeota archaeon RBG_13_36_9]|nr:MAG: hypothetical protein A3K73_03450 [Candidatus Pacearchaeota archaeon RBG_13_36_9]